MDENCSWAGTACQRAGPEMERRNLIRNVRRGLRRSGSAGNIGRSGVLYLWKGNVIFMEEIGTYTVLWKRLASMEEIGTYGNKTSFDGK